MSPFATIVGASGFMGHALYSFLKKELPKEKIEGTYYSNHEDQRLDYLDICDEDLLTEYLLKHRPVNLLLLAGSKNIQKCEQNYEFAYKINTLPVAIILKTIKKYNLHTRLLFFSTDYVFDGEHGPFKENDLPNPNVNYGKTNYVAEKLLVNSGIDYNIIRTSAVIGRGARFYDWLLNELTHSEHVEMFDDINFTPTPISLVCKIMLEFLKNTHIQEEHKITHLVGANHYSRYSFALELRKHITQSCCESINPVKAPEIFQKNLTMVQSGFINKCCNISINDFFNEDLKYD